ncbi:MAG: low-specificity L-threonine aldolase [Armatimonadota bacterium]|nr:low-specificity L-threonine aldolase [Armatimonadota bacterium]MDW8156268.1 low-specificity L-threonine aldolase [Armatimonadota bacterium]
MQPVVDLRSDTVTQPTERMREAMAAARVGDDVFREDPTVAELEQLAARMVGHRAGLFCSSGTMANLVAVLAHCQRGDAVFADTDAHVLHYEAGGLAVLAGTFPQPIRTADGNPTPEELEAAVPPPDVHRPHPRLVWLENTHNRAGGVAYPPERTAAVAWWAHARGLRVHLDGARLFNAAVALGVPAADLASPADSVMVSLSKGLSAPVGSVLCGSEEFIEHARRWRKVVGGGMRQVGVLAAAGLVALREMVDRLAEDHRRARALAEGLAQVPGVAVDTHRVHTNIVLARVADAAAVVEHLRAHGVLALALDPHTIRFVTHRHVDDEGVERAVRAMREAVVSARR